MQIQQVVLTVFILASVGFFIWSVLRIFRFVRLGKSSYDSVDKFGWRVSSVLKDFFGQMSVVREPSGWGHFFIFWGFMVLGMATIEMFVRGYNPDFNWGILLGHSVESVLNTVFDFFGFAVMVAIIIGLIRGFIVNLTV